ncbi:MAG TPA: S8 family peptidase [Solimonas sp.]|nr:S8 family peptidase [Solimonas sp.]
MAAAVLGTLPQVAGADEGPAQQIIVKVRESHAHPDHRALVNQVTQLAETSTRIGLTPLRRIGTGADVIRLDQRVDPHALKGLLTALAANPLVEYAEEDRLLKARFTPNDSRYSEQWHYYEATGGLNLPAAWDLSTGSGVIVGVLDTGYRPHADLNANIVGGYDFISDTAVSVDGDGRDANAQDPGDWYSLNQCGIGSGSSNSSWHGTHVAGTIAAVTNNASGVAGVAYNAKVLPLRVLGKCGGYTSDIADAIIWGSGGTVSGLPANPNVAKVLNLSLGGSGACDATSQAAINSARSRGTVVIVAAGNENTNASNSSPANCSGVVTVAAVNRSGGRASYSNYGAVVDVAAPGGQQSSGTDPNGILSTLNAGTQGPGADSYAFYQGTSMATPHVAGVAALMLAKTPGLTPDQIESTLKSTARAFPATCSQCGTGIVDAVAALGGSAPPPPPPPGPTALSNGVALTNLSGATGSQAFFTLTVPAGATGLKFEMSGGTGDADLYVKFGAAPTTSVYDCRPYLNGNTETCSITTAQAGTYHVMLNAYSAYSGVSLKGSYSTGGGGTCAAGFTPYSGTLSAGGNAYLPGTGGYASSVSGTHSGRLTGPSGADFDLYLQKLGATWSNVKSSTGSTSTESVDYSGTSGTYRWRVYAYSGSGSYTLCTKKP